jgi:hypothetical protein
LKICIVVLALLGAGSLFVAVMKYQALREQRQERDGALCAFALGKVLEKEATIERAFYAWLAAGTTAEAAALAVLVARRR